MAGMAAPHYIRCIKPNDTQTPNSFIEERVLHQVKYLGLADNLEICRAGMQIVQHHGSFTLSIMLIKRLWKSSILFIGYCYRLDTERFVQRYKYLSSRIWPHPGVDTSSQECCRFILEDCLGGPFLPSVDFTYGLTKIFIRKPQVMHQSFNVMQEFMESYFG